VIPEPQPSSHGDPHVARGASSRQCSESQGRSGLLLLTLSLGAVDPKEKSAVVRKTPPPAIAKRELFLEQKLDGAVTSLA
jgi:hypothetical protein